MPLPFETVAERIHAGLRSPLYVLAGPDGFQQSAVLAALAAGVPELGVQHLDGAAITPQQVVAALRSAALVPGHLVVVDDAPWIAAPQRRAAEDGGARGKAPPAEEPLLRYLEQPVADAALVLRSSAEPDRRRRLVKRAAEVGVLLACVPPRDIGPYLRERCAALGLRLAPDIFALLAARLQGAECGRVDAEVRKLAAYGAAPDRAALDALVPPADEERIYALVDAALAGRAAEAQAAAAALRAQAEPVPRLLYALGAQLRTLVQVRAACRDGTRPEAVAGQLGVPPFVARKAYEQAHRLPAAAVEAALEAVWAAEWGYKSGRLLEDTALDRAVLGVLVALRPAGSAPSPTEWRRG